MDLCNEKLANDTNTDQLLRAQAHVWNHTFSYINSMSLRCATQLGIPDAIHRHGRPITMPELLAALPTVHPSKADYLPRLLRILVHSGFFTKSGGDEEAYGLTPASRLLLQESSLNQVPFLAGLLVPAILDPWLFLGSWFGSSDPTTAFGLAHGKAVWELIAAEPRTNQLFNAAMASDGELVARVLHRECKGMFDGLKTLVDVAGGTGGLATALARGFPEKEWTVLDLPHVVDGLQGSKNLHYVGGDMFEAIPSADAVLLKWILHDWNERECIRILKRSKESLSERNKGTKVIIIDSVMGSNSWVKEDINQYHQYDKAIETQLFFDMLMMVLSSGKERNEKDWADLFFGAGFSGYKIIPILGLRSIIEVYP